MKTVYKCLIKTSDWGVFNDKKWTGTRLIVHEETLNDNGECVQALTKQFKATENVSIPASSVRCNLLFDSHGRITRIESIGDK